MQNKMDSRLNRTRTRRSLDTPPPLEIILSDRDEENRLSTLNELEELNYYLSDDEEVKKEYEILYGATDKGTLDLTHPNEENVNVSFGSSGSSNGKS